MEIVLQSASLVKRAYWLVHLRWLAIGVLAAGTAIATRIFHISVAQTHLYVLAGVLLLYNLGLFGVIRYFTREGAGNSDLAVSRVITFQISADLFILTTILHFSGGIINPFYFYFVFHMIIASTLLSARQSYLQATLAVALFGLLGFGEQQGILTHYKLVGLVSHDLHRDGMFVFITFMVFATTIYTVVYMATNISAQLRKQQAETERANAQLLQKDNLKNEYVLRLTHDIRGHLAAIRSCLDIVADEMVGPLNARQDDLIERAARRASKCSAFVDALLKLTRMKLTGKVDMGYFSIRNPIFNALAAVERRAKGKSIKIECEIDPGVDEVYGEATLIEEAVSNFLFNAARYTPEGGRVKVSVKEEGDNVLVQVRDTGIGIPEGEKEKIFEEFYRAENARKTERDGTGLGLSIARQVVERHGGRIWAENNEGGGSTFSFSIPKRRAKA
jgi:signal transduction histidine kinase